MKDKRALLYVLLLPEEGKVADHHHHLLEGEDQDQNHPSEGIPHLLWLVKEDTHPHLLLPHHV